MPPNVSRCSAFVGLLAFVVAVMVTARRPSPVATTDVPTGGRGEQLAGAAGTCPGPLRGVAAVGLAVTVADGVGRPLLGAAPTGKTPGPPPITVGQSPQASTTTSGTV